LLDITGFALPATAVAPGGFTREVGEGLAVPPALATPAGSCTPPPAGGGGFELIALPAKEKLLPTIEGAEEVGGKLGQAASARVVKPVGTEAVLRASSG